MKNLLSNTRSQQTITSNVVSFVTSPQDASGNATYNIIGKVFDCTTSGFNPNDHCMYEGLAGQLTFVDGTFTGNQCKGKVQFDSNIATLVGDYIINGRSFNVLFSDLLLTGNISSDLRITRGQGKHYAGENAIHNFSWTGSCLNP